MNAIKLAAVYTITKTALIFYINKTEAELCPKFHDEYLLSIFKK